MILKHILFQGCLSICLQERVINECGCFQKLNDELNRMLKRDGVDPCKTPKSKYFFCFLHILSYVHLSTKL